MGHRTALGADRPLGAERSHVRRLRDRGGLRPGARVGRVGGEARAEARSAGAVSWARAARAGGRARRGLVGARSAGWWARAARVGRTGLPNANLRGPTSSTGHPPRAER